MSTGLLFVYLWPQAATNRHSHRMLLKCFCIYNLKSSCWKAIIGWIDGAMYKFYWHMFSKCWQHISNIQNVHSLTLRPKGAQKPSDWRIFPKCWQHISNANIYITKCTFLGAQNPLTDPIVGMIYPIPIYKYNWHVFLKSEYKYKYYKIYICIGYILPTVRKNICWHVSWKVSVNPLGTGLGTFWNKILYWI